MIIFIVVFEIYWLMMQTGFYFLLFITTCLQELLKGFSVLYLDTGKYNLELNNYTTSTHTGITYFVYLSFFYLFLNLIITIFNEKIVKTTDVLVAYPIKDIRYTLVYAVGYFGIAYLLMDMLVSGIPLLSGGSIDRYNYWADYSTLPLAKYVSLMLTIMCVAAGMDYATQRIQARKNNRWIYLIALIFLFRILLGYKASGLVDLVIGFAVGYFYRTCTFKTNKKQSIVKLIAFIIVIYVVLILFFAITQIISGKYATFDEAIQAIFDRTLSLSGHMEWSVLSDPSVSHSWWINNPNEITSIFRGADDMDPDLGVYVLMDKYAPFETFNVYFDRKVRFVAGFIGVSVFYNGRILTILLCACNALILAVFYYQFIRLARKNYVLTFSLLYYVYNLFTTYLDGSGTLTSFWNINTYVYLVGIVLIYYIEKSFLSDRFQYNIRVLPKHSEFKVNY